MGITNYHVGLTATTADFYAGRQRPTWKGIVMQKQNLIPTLQKANVLNFEMETATLFTLASVCRLRAGAICAVYANRCTNQFKQGAGEENMIKIANETVKFYMNGITKNAKGRKTGFFHRYYPLNENSFRPQSACLYCRGGRVVNALASRSCVGNIEGWMERQVSQWAFGLAGVRIPSPALMCYKIF